jgi:hypothetical protein
MTLIGFEHTQLSGTAWKVTVHVPGLVDVSTATLVCFCGCPVPHSISTVTDVQLVASPVTTIDVRVPPVVIPVTPVIVNVHAIDSLHQYCCNRGHVI